MLVFKIIFLGKSFAFSNLYNAKDGKNIGKQRTTLEKAVSITAFLAAI